MKFFRSKLASHPLYSTINAAYLADESEIVAALLKQASLPPAVRDRISERALSVNTTAAGGNASLMSLQEEDA